ncbi:sigma-70 family RNA polymerase sigma factor [Nonomuraea sp. NPDC050536]|uniref:sigma-70 family RNA polymerase sigma factor n=1 Tax=Nonomuraea sp. NPDC050536 TaxID=3364366 RepID=UPI0037C79B9F
MNDYELLAQRFQEHRPLLTAVASQILGSPSEAEDAVQEAWLRLSRSYPDHVENLPAWMTTIVTRVSLNMRRRRNTLREDPVDPLDCQATARSDEEGPEDEVLWGESVSLALLMLLDLLTPAERLAFVMHDLFAVPFEEIAPIVQRSTVATRKLASRARRRLENARQIGHRPPDTRSVVEAVLAALRRGDLEALLSTLHPEDCSAA